MSTLTNIQILRSAVPYKRPDPSFLLDGQLGINYKDEEPGLFTKLQSGDLVKFGPVAITTTGFAPNSSPSADGFPGNSVGEEWLDSRGAFYRPIEHVYDGTAWQVTNGFEVDYNTGDFTLLKKLTISALEADVAHIDGPLMVNGHITPDGTTCAHNLGNGSERWAGIYACAGDISGDLSLGGSLTLGQDLDIGGTLSVDTDIIVNGNATFGSACGDGKKFTVKSPTYLNCLVEILGHTQGTDMTLSGDLVVEGDVTFGQGCSTTLTVKSKTIFQCDVEFNTNPVTFEYLVITDLLDSQGDTILGTNCNDKITVNGSATFANCITTFEGETRIGLGSGAALRTFGPNVFNQDIRGNADLKIKSGKGYSLETVSTDSSDTLITKGYVEQLFNSTVHPWEKSGQALLPRETGLSVLPNGTGNLGAAGGRWGTFFGKTLSLAAKGTSAETVNGDPINTLITKKWTEDMVDQKVTDAGHWDKIGSDLIPKVSGASLLPKGTANLGLATSRWDSVNANSMSLANKGTSAVTIDSDPSNTLITKGWTEALVSDSITSIDFWQRNGIQISPLTENDDVVPYGTNSNLGVAGKIWKKVNAESLALTAKGTSALTVDSDPDSTLTTKKWVEDSILAGNPTTYWDEVSGELVPKVLNQPVVPNGLGYLGTSTDKWHKVYAADTYSNEVLPNNANGKIGTSTNKWDEVHANNVYTGDLHMKNERGDWTLIEEEDCLTMTNNKTGKRYAISMTPYTG